MRPLALALAAAGLLAAGWAVSPRLWAALSALAALRVALDWPMSDNHGYLLAIWCAALALAFADARPRALLARNARLLVGLAFLLATLQKIWAPDYLDGTFFRWALAVDPRFEDLGALLGRGAEDLERTRIWLTTPPHAPLPPEAGFVETPALRLAAHALGWATVILEGIVALAFLAPPALGIARLRDAALLVFCAGTYAIAPVAGFGWLLLSMGVAQSQGAGWRVLYLAVFALVLFYREVPWLGLIVGS